MRNAVSRLILATTLFGAVQGCTVEAHGRVRAPPPPTATVEVEVEEEPPPPRRVVIESRPGYVFIEGRWYRRGGRWEWADGRWERERVGHVWVPGRWDRRGHRHVWVEGSWHANGGAVIRDHR